MRQPKHRSRTSKRSSSKLPTRSLHKHLLLNLNSSNNNHNFTRKPISTACRLLSSSLCSSLCSSPYSSPCSSPFRVSMHSSSLTSSIRRSSRLCHNKSSPNQQLIISRSTLSRHQLHKPIHMPNQFNNNCHRHPTFPRSNSSPRPFGTDMAFLAI